MVDLTRLFRICALAGVAALASAASCSRPASIQLDTPVHGTFTTAPSVNVTGRIKGKKSQVVDVLVNGSSVLPLGPLGAFSATVLLDPVAIFNPVIVELVKTNGQTLRRRVTVIAGDSIADGDLTEMGVALRLDDSGLDQVEPIIESEFADDLDPGALITNPVVGFTCFYEDFFGNCINGINSVNVNTAAMGFNSFGLDVDSQTNFVDGVVTVNDLFVPYTANLIAIYIPISCNGQITAATTTIDADYTLSADANDETDVNQTTFPNVTFSSFNNEFTSGICDFPLIGSLISAIVGNVEPLVESSLEQGLDDPDGAGPLDSPIAEGAETALAGIDISGPIGQAIGVSLETPLFDVFEDVDGLTFDSDLRITASMPDPNAVDLPASYHVPEPFPSFGPTTPVGGLPYELALCISTSGFNQLLKAEIESGLLLTSLTELDLGGGPQPLTAGLLAFVPGFDTLDPATPLRIDLAPTLGPIVTGEDGPTGELAELRISHLLANVVNASDGTVYLTIAVDALLGLDINFVAGQLSFDLGTIQAQDIGVTILNNPLGSPEGPLTTLLVSLLPAVLPTLADSLGTFPLPGFLGLSLDLVEISKNGEFMSLFLDLTPAP